MATTTPEERQAILEAAQEVNRTEAAHKAAVARFDALIEGRRSPRAKAERKGKSPDPTSLNQRVLKAITDSPSPVAVNSLAVLLGEEPKKVRYAIVYHQKRGRVVHAGQEGQYTLKGRMTLNGNGAKAAQ
jgi:hypothetical protein